MPTYSMSDTCAKCSNTYGHHYSLNGGAYCNPGRPDLFTPHSSNTTPTWKKGDLAFVAAKRYDDGVYLLADTNVVMMNVVGMANPFTHQVPCQVFGIDHDGQDDMEIMIEIDPSWLKANPDSNNSKLGCWVGGKEYQQKFGCDPNKLYYWTSKECLVPRSGRATINREQEKAPLCVQCGNGAPMAQANLTTGGFCCYSCRQAYGWKYNRLLIKA